jgi:hypothetical protein
VMWATCNAWSRSSTPGWTLPRNWIGLPAIHLCCRR